MPQVPELSSLAARADLNTSFGHGTVRLSGRNHHRGAAYIWAIVARLCRLSLSMVRLFRRRTFRGAVLLGKRACFMSMSLRAVRPSLFR